MTHSTRVEVWKVQCVCVCVCVVAVRGPVHTIIWDEHGGIKCILVDHLCTCTCVSLSPCMTCCIVWGLNKCPLQVIWTEHISPHVGVFIYCDWVNRNLFMFACPRKTSHNCFIPANSFKISTTSSLLITQESIDTPWNSTSLTSPEIAPGQRRTTTSMRDSGKSISHIDLKTADMVK